MLKMAEFVIYAYSWFGFVMFSTSDTLADPSRLLTGVRNGIGTGAIDMITVKYVNLVLSSQSSQFFSYMFWLMGKVSKKCV